jgi:predicted PurR-regulated permease PerM
MLGIDRHSARSTWTAALVLLSLVLVYILRRTLFIFILALLFAYLLSPLVNLLNRALPGRTRTPALALAYVLFVGAVVLIAIQIGSRVTEEAGTLAKNLPSMIAEWEKPSLNLPPMMNSFKAQLVEKVRSQVEEGSSMLFSTLPQAGLKFLTVASDAIYIVIIPILAFFFLKDAGVIRDHILDLVDEGPRRVILDDLISDIHLLLAHYMRALVLLSLSAFVAYNIFFLATSTPYGVLLAALGGLFEFIPMLGPLTAAIIITIVTAVSGGSVLAALIFLGVYRILQDYILSPHLMGQGVELHPLLVVFGVVAGAEIAGIPGTFLSVPVLALVRIVYLRIRKAKLAARLEPAARVRT